MLKEFTYTVKLVIQHKILATLDFITQDFDASIEIGEKDYFIPFPLNSEIVLSKMDLEITNFLFLRKYRLEDIDFISYEVSTEDMYIDIFFESEVDQSTQNIKPQIEVSFIPVSFQPATPLNFYGTLVDSNTIEWSWNGVDNCGYRLYDQDDKIVAEVGIDVRLHLEVSLVAGVNHTRRITSFNEHGESESSNFITVEVPLIELASSIEIRENTLSKTNTKEISPVEEDVESMPAFKSGVGDNLDLLVNTVEELTVNERFQFDIMLEGYSREMQKHYTAIPFTYKVSASGKRYIDGVVDTDIATKVVPWPVCNVNYIMKSYIYNPFVHNYSYKISVKYDVIVPRVMPTVPKPVFKDMFTIDGRTLESPKVIDIQSISVGPEANLLDMDVSTDKLLQMPHGLLIEQLEDDGITEPNATITQPNKITFSETVYDDDTGTSPTVDIPEMNGFILSSIGATSYTAAFTSSDNTVTFGFTGTPKIGQTLTYIYPMWDIDGNEVLANTLVAEYQESGWVFIGSAESVATINNATNQITFNKAVYDDNTGTHATVDIPEMNGFVLSTIGATSYAASFDASDRTVTFEFTGVPLKGQTLTYIYPMWDGAGNVTPANTLVAQYTIDGWAFITKADTWVSDGEILPENTSDAMSFATKGLRLNTTTEGSIDEDFIFPVIGEGVLGSVYVYPTVYETLYKDIIYNGTATVNSPETDKLLINLLTYVSADPSLANAKPGSISIVSATLTSSNSNVTFKILGSGVYATCTKNQNFFEYNRTESLNLSIENGKIKEIVQPSEVKLINMYSNQYVGAKLPTTLITYVNVSPFLTITDGQGNVQPITIINRFPSLTITLKTPTNYFICSAQLKDEITSKKLTLASMFSGLVATEYSLEVVDLSSKGLYTFFTDKTTEVISGLNSKFIRIDNAAGAYLQFNGTPGKALMHWLEESAILHGTVNGKEPMRKNEDGKRDFVSVAPSFDMSIATIDPVYTVEIIDAGGKIIDIRCRNQIDYSKTLVNGDVIVFSSGESEMVETYGKWIGPAIRTDELEITTSGIMSFYSNIYNPLFDYSVQNMDISDVRINVQSLNPNVRVNPVNTDIINFASDEYRNTLKIPFLFEAKILSPSQNAWSPVIIPGHYYINNEEYFLHANPKPKGINYVTTTPLVKSFYASIKAGIETKADASAFTKVMNTRSSFSAGTKELVIINDSGTISLVENGTEVGYPTYPVRGYYTSEPLSFHEAVMLLETDIIASNKDFTKVYICYESNSIWSEWQPAVFGVIFNFGENADQFKIKIELDRISIPQEYSNIIIDQKKVDWLLTGYEASNIIMEENLLVLKDASISGLYVSPIFTIDMSHTEIFKFLLDLNREMAIGYEYKFSYATSTTIEGIESSVANWQDITTTLDIPIVANTYMRYKIEIPMNSKIAFNGITKIFDGHVMRQSSPLVSSITVTSETPEWMFVGYVNKSILCKLPMDEQIHDVTDYDILDVIYPDILASGIANPRIKSLEIFIIDTTVEISFEEDGNTPLKAKTLSSDSVSIESIYVALDDEGIGQLAPVPQLGRPVIAVHKTRGPLRHVTFFDNEDKLTLTNTEILRYDGRNSLSLGYTRIDAATLVITNGNDGSIIPIKKIINSNVYFGDTFNAQIDDELICKYMIKNSFTIDYNFDLDTNRAQILVHLESNTPVTEFNGVEMFYEIDDYSDYYATELELNPLYNDISTGFIYLTHEDNIPKNIEIKMNPEVFDANGTDCAYMFIKVTDQIGNPVSNISVQISSGYGKILLTDNITNKFGVVTAKYFSPDYECQDTLIATTTEYDVTTTKKLLIKEPTTRIFVTAVSNIYTIAQGDSISIEAKVFSEDLVPYAAQDMTLFLANYYGDSITMSGVTDAEGKCYFDVIPLINTANNVSRIEITSMGVKEYIDIKEVI